MEGIAEFAVDRFGKCYDVRDERLRELPPERLSPVERGIIRKQTNTLFHHSYSSLLFWDPIEKSVISRHRTDFSSFYPSTHLEFCDALDDLVETGFCRPVKLFLNPTNVCNFRCQICSFNPTRHRKGLYSLTWSVVEDAIRFIAESAPTGSVNISGGGEPSLVENTKRALALCSRLGLKTFLTTNGSSTDRELWEVAASTCSIIVVSIRGLSEAAYKRIDAPVSDAWTFGRAVERVASLVAKRSALSRSRSLVIGVNSLVHPSNTGQYARFVSMADSIGVDFVYYTPVAPNLEHWGLSVLPDQVVETEREFDDIRNSRFRSSLKVRVPRVAYRSSAEDSYYLAINGQADAAPRPECYVGVFSPALVPSDVSAGWAKLSPCRSSRVQDENNLAFALDIGQRTIREVWSREACTRVRRDVGAWCGFCHLERQFRDLAFMVAEKKRFRSGAFALCFRAGQGGGSAVNTF